MTGVTTRLVRNGSFLSMLGAVLLGALVAIKIPLNGFGESGLLWAFVSVFLFFVFRNSGSIMKGSLYGYLSFQLLHVLFAIDALSPGDFRPHLLAVGLGTVTGLYLLIKDFKYFWSFPFFRLLLVFFLFSLIYVFFYGTDFNLTSFSAGYPIDFLSDNSDTDAKTIAFLANYVTLLATIMGLSVFRTLRTPDAIESRLSVLLKYISFSSVPYFLILAGFVFKPLLPGQGIILALFVFIMIGFAIAFENKMKPGPLWKNPVVVIYAMLPLALISVVLVSNKSALVGYAATFLLMILLNLKYVPRIQILNKLFNMLKTLEVKLLLIALVLIFLGVAGALGVFALLADKMDYFSKGFSSMSTLTVRTGNWYYFTIEWRDTLNFLKALFGYGLGASRETIFYVSAMRQTGERTLVQTLHNSYMETFYDYGLVGALLYISTLMVVWDDIKCIIRTQAHRNAKIFSILSLSCIVYLGIYAMTDGVRVHILMPYYATIMMIEGLKRAYKETENTAVPDMV